MPTTFEDSIASLFKTVKSEFKPDTSELVDLSVDEFDSYTNLEDLLVKVAESLDAPVYRLGSNVPAKRVKKKRGRKKAPVRDKSTAPDAAKSDRLKRLIATVPASSDEQDDGMKIAENPTTTRRPKRGKASSKNIKQSLSVPKASDGRNIENKNPDEITNAGRPRRRKAAPKAPKLSAVSTPMKVTRSTKQTRPTRVRKAVTPKSAFRRKALQELVNNASAPNTPKEPGEGLRPKQSSEQAFSGSEDNVLPSERTDDISSSRQSGRADFDAPPLQVNDVSADEESPVVRRFKRTEVRKSEDTDSCPVSECATRQISSEISLTAASEVDVVGEQPGSLDNAEDDEADGDQEYEAEDMDTDSNSENGTLHANVPTVSAPKSKTSNRRVSFATDKNPESKDNPRTESGTHEESVESRGTRFRVDESGNVVDTGVQDLLNIAHPSTSSKAELERSRNPALPKKSFLPQPVKKHPAISSQKSIISSSRQPVLKTPGMKPLNFAKQTGTVDRTYDEAIHDLFKPSIFSAAMQSRTKKICFAADKTVHLSDNNTVKKRSFESIDLTSPAVVKRPRSDYSSTFQGKSALRERMENFRRSKSNKPQTPSTSAVHVAQSQLDAKEDSSIHENGSSSVKFSTQEADNSSGAAAQTPKDDGRTTAPFSEGHEEIPRAKTELRDSSELSNTPKSLHTSSQAAMASKTKFSQITPGETLSEMRQSSPDKDAVLQARESRDKSLSSEKIEETQFESTTPSLPPSEEQVVENKSNVLSSSGSEQNARENIRVDQPEVQSNVAKTERHFRAPAVLNNLMTSVKSFMPASLLGYAIDDGNGSEEETEEMRNKRVAEEIRLDADRREAEIIARREAFRQARQAEALEKQKRVEAKRKALALAEQKRQEELRQKEAERMRKLRADIDARKAKKAEDEKKREQRRKKVLEHNRKMKEAEEARRAEFRAKEEEQRRRKQQQQGGLFRKGGGAPSNFKGRGGAGPSNYRNGDMLPPSAKAPKTPGSQRALFGSKKKDSVEFTSYELSVEKPNLEESSDEEDGNRVGRKRIPDWAKQSNVREALETQTEDPDNHFSRVRTVNLEEVFANAKVMKRRYRTRQSSGQWARDRLTAMEEMEYKKKAGYI